jgi:stage V sporulation protein R
MRPTGTTPSSRATTCSEPGPAPTRSSITWSSPVTTSAASASSATARLEVELLLDSCHALMNLRRGPLQAPERRCRWPRSEERQREREEPTCKSQVNDLWRTVPGARPGAPRRMDSRARFPPEPQENLLYFIEKNAPLLEPWQREVVRIVRKLAQYFYPAAPDPGDERGLGDLLALHPDESPVRRGLVAEGLHAGVPAVAHQRDLPALHTARWYSGINPYALGFAMFSDIKRICEKPTEEDRRWFPDIAGSDWRKTLEFAMRNFKDESFIAAVPLTQGDPRPQAVHGAGRRRGGELEVGDPRRARLPAHPRDPLADQYNLGSASPTSRSGTSDLRGDRSLTLRHVQDDRRGAAALTSLPATPSAAAAVTAGSANWARWRPRRPGPGG